MMMSYNTRLIIGANAQALQKGIKKAERVDFDSRPHLLISGSSGSGKTYLLLQLLKQIAEKNAQIILADFKGIDFSHFDGSKNYYKHTKCMDALNIVYEELQSRMEGNIRNYKPLFFIFDEWAAFVNYYSKKEQSVVLSKMSSLLMLARSAGIIIIVAVQRPDANILQGRDNFGNRVALGVLSNEARRMLFLMKKSLAQKEGDKGIYIVMDIC